MTYELKCTEFNWQPHILEWYAAPKTKQELNEARIEHDAIKTIRIDGHEFCSCPNT